MYNTKTTTTVERKLIDVSKIGLAYNKWLEGYNYVNKEFPTIYISAYYGGAGESYINFLCPIEKYSQTAARLLEIFSI